MPASSMHSAPAWPDSQPVSQVGPWSVTVLNPATVASGPVQLAAGSAVIGSVAQSGAWAVSVSGSVALSGGNTTAVNVKEPSIRGVAAIGASGASGLLLSVGVAGAAKLAFADGSTLTAYFPAGVTYLRAVPVSVTPTALTSPLLSALTLLDAKATIES